MADFGTVNRFIGLAYYFKAILGGHSFVGRHYSISSCQKWMVDKIKGKRSNEEILDKFWDQFLNQLGGPSSSSSTVELYHDDVFNLLKNYKAEYQTTDMSELYNLQRRIENLTMYYDKESLYKTSPYLLSRLTQGDFPTAMDYLKGFLKEEEKEEAEVLHWLNGGYALEAICIYVLGLVFSSAKDSPVVKVSTLVDQLNSVVRVQSNIEKSHKMVLKGGETAGVLPKEGANEKRKGRRFAIGMGLVQFLMERELIVLSTDMNFSVILGKKGYYPLNCYAMCNFDLSILPVKLNLPMVFSPKAWDIDDGVASSLNDKISSLKNKLALGKITLSEAERIFLLEVEITLSDITGGYLCGHTGEMFNRFKVLTTRNHDYFNIYLRFNRFGEIASIMNGLQSQPFVVNHTLLNFIEDHRSTLEKAGLLMPRILASINMREACLKLREYYFKDEEGLKGACKLDYLLAEFQKRVQRARYEDFVIKLASAYDGYTFYLPAFLDFRGRIYRAGILHFHERDLSKSLIMFKPQPYVGTTNFRELRGYLSTSASFKFQKFPTYDDALSWYKKVKNKFHDNPQSLIQFAVKASDPFQFMSKALTIQSDDIDQKFELWGHPATQDASASAYQIMSYLLLNIEMAKLTNLIPTDDGLIQDMYLSLQKELLLFLEDKFPKSIFEIIKVFLSRKLVKSIFMPLIYGKTLISINNDIKLAFGSYLDNKDCMLLSQNCHLFFCKKFPDIVNLMKLISKIAWFCSAVGRPVLYNTDYYITVQDYMCSATENIQIYNRITQKRHRVTLRIPTTKRDKRKTQVSTFANFIHQKDAFIAMRVVNELLSKEAPVYTVHDNFLTTLPFVKEVSKIYTGIFTQLGSPIKFINQFIDSNLLKDKLDYFLYENNPHLINEITSTEKLLSFLGGQTGGPIHWVKNPIPIVHLKYILEWNIPQDIHLSERKKLGIKIDEILKYYETYVNNVCGCNTNDVIKAGKAHSEKWNQFKKSIKIWNTFDHNYSLHY